MKKVLFAAFAGLCVLSSIMATPAHKGNVKIQSGSWSVLRDTVPPAPDTTKKMNLIQSFRDTVPPTPDTTKKVF